jgi:hypothetical protein
MKRLLLLVLLSPAMQDRTIGLLTLPEVFGNGACDRFVLGEVRLFASPDSQRAVGTIRVDRNWSFPAEGGCEGLRVGVHLTDPAQSSELPVREYDYEIPAAIVLEQRGGWFKVRLSDGAAWLRASAKDRFLPLRELLTRSLTHLTDEFGGRLAMTPGGAQTVQSDSTLAGRTVNVGGFREIAGQLWIQVEILSWSLCESDEKPAILGRGWVPAHTKSGEPAVWFYSRGC